MWKCHKCQKPVYFAERKHSLGYNWHPECLRCEECGKRLNPGQHAEHKGVPYCHVPCYGALFGPQLFGHGTRVESHKSFGLQKDSPKLGNKPILPRSTLESKIKVYNHFYEGKSGEIRCREVNGRYILEGSLRIHWGVQGVIHLKENDDQRTVVTVRKRNSCRASSSPEYDTDDDIQNISTDSSFNDVTSNTTTLDKDIESSIDSLDSIALGSNPSSPKNNMPKSVTLPSKLDVKNMERDELDDLLQVERVVDNSVKLYQTMPAPLPSQITTESDTLSSKTSSSEESKNGTKTVTITEDASTLKATIGCDNNKDGTLSEDKIPLLTNSFSSKEDTWVLNSNHLNRSMSGPDCLERLRDSQSPEFDKISITSSDATTNDGVVLRRPQKSGSTAIRRRPGKRLSRSKVKRRCSINGHFYDRETSFFTPPHGSQMSVWITSLVNTHEVIKLLLEKYKVESDPNNFALFIVRDSGEQRRLKEDEYPLLARVLLGPHEDVAKLFLMDSHSTPEVSSEVAQFLNLSQVECRAILSQYYSQEEREVAKIKEKYCEMKRRIIHRLQLLSAGS
ncbi:ras association family member [Rhynchophorus ferrugineus]|uniref:ras association family member n=1 Tax=Rhynchophorus ferrugineus TaxID=354439 RepID=UPI003FCD4C3B